MKERCHICGRKMKPGLVQCKVCKAQPEEKIVSGCSAAHNVNFLVNPFVNLILTDRRLLVFEDVSIVGAQTTMHGGLVGGLIGHAADKVVAKTLGSNGSLKLDVPLSSIANMETEDKGSKGLQIIIGLSGEKTHKFTVAASAADPSASEFASMIRSAAKG